MIPVSRLSDQHSCPVPLHGITPLTGGSAAVFVNGLPVARVGDKAGCGAVIVSGFPHILIDNRPMAHVGSITSHGGTIVTGSHDCVGGNANLITSKLVVDFAKLGAVSEEGAVDERLMAELLADPQLEERARAAGALVQTTDGTTTCGSPFIRSFVVTEKETRRLLAYRNFVVELNGHLFKGATDANGVAHIKTNSPDASMSVHVFFKAPARELTELSESSQHTVRSFKTSVSLRPLTASQKSTPMAIAVDDRAATREAIIREVRSQGQEFIERSGWEAKGQKQSIEQDWDYSMIALHHAGRSYSCGTAASVGADQMRAIQKSHLFDRKYDDISYHFGIDCSGNIYEGRDIRHKGGSVLKYNTGVIGIVLLNNLSTTDEGDDLVALARGTMKKLGIDTTSQIHASQEKASLVLIEALRSTFKIMHLGGHKEFPNQIAEGKICPGNIAMKLVEKIRFQTGLIPPTL